MEKEHDTVLKANLINYKDKQRFTCEERFICEGKKCSSIANIILTKLMGVAHVKKNIYVCFECYEKISTSSYVKTLNLRK
jgi:hypothetical protein